MPIINDPAFMGNVEHLISESTYGGILHDPPSDMDHQIAEVLSRTSQRGGKIIIPAFSVGRTQDIVYAFNSLRQKGKLPNIPIYIDSPLAVNATDIFRRHPECYDEETKEFLLNNEDPFGMKQLHYVRTVEDSKRLNDIKGSCIIIAASGMCEAGRIRHHLANNIENPKHTILIVGYQAEHTLGRKLVEQWEEIKIFGELFKRKAEVVVLNSLSAHADGNELLKYINRFDKKQLQKVYLVHGEVTRMQKLQAGLKEQGFNNTEIPFRGQKFDV
jgi:metallo-beta-lactamase family protein